MKLSKSEARERLAAARIARLATTGDDRQPHLVPVTFAVDQDPARGDLIYIAIDHKPKTTTNLRRLRNIRENPRVTLLVDHYEEDWSRLWWIRADGRARILGAEEAGRSDPLVMRGSAIEDERKHPLGLLAAKYEQYRRLRPEGPVIAITIARMTGWSGDN